MVEIVNYEVGNLRAVFNFTVDYVASFICVFLGFDSLNRIVFILKCRHKVMVTL